MESFWAFLLFSVLICLAVYLKTHKISLHRDGVLILGTSLGWALFVILFISRVPSLNHPIIFTTFYLFGVIFIGIYFVAQAGRVSQRQALFQLYGKTRGWTYQKGSLKFIPRKLSWSFLNAVLIKNYARNILQCQEEGLTFTIFEYLPGWGENQDFQDTAILPSLLVCDLVVPQKFPPLALLSQSSLDLPWNNLVFPGWKKITFESKEFNDGFQVFSSQPSWAYEAMQPLTMEVLLRRDHQFSLEIKGSHLLFSYYHGEKEVETKDIENLHNMVFSFYKALPQWIKDKYMGRIFRGANEKNISFG